MAARLVLLATTHRVAPGLLTGSAWTALRAADVVLLPEAEHGLLPVLEDAGIPARVVEVPSGDDAVAVHAGTLLAELRGDEDPAYPDGRTVVWLLPEAGDSGLAQALADAAGAGDVVVDLVTGSWDLPGARLLDLVAVMDRLRSPAGCPWDAAQTHETLVEYLVEEAYEVVEAIETHDDEALREELGDLLLQVVFHARIAQERPLPWGIDEVADGIASKLVRRHPHVFGDAEASSAEQLEESWSALKHAEKGRESATDGIPQALPALVLAAKLLSRSARVPGVPVAGPVVEAVADAAYDETRDDPGALLLALVARMRRDGVDPEQALRRAARGYRARVRDAEGLSG